MAQNRNKKIRDLRKRGKDRLVKVNDQLNTLSWDLCERNVALADANTTEATAILDQALDLIQNASALLNSVTVAPAPEVAEDVKPAAPKARASIIEPKIKAENDKTPPVATLKT